ncbi:MAG TPA: glycosyltransferase [Pyrinomonadaceae bacterium]|jgi:glycosyltransferase involved in cell wall biosynthesis|nr:glycosyltransferase [Pyrinomonadaceae bacterium]
MTTPIIKLLAVIEATTVNGPAKNLIKFCLNARDESLLALTGLPRVETTVVTFHRGRDTSNGHTHSDHPDGDASREAPNEFVAAARAAGIEVDVINERFRFDSSVLEQLRSIVRRRAPDVVQTHMIKSHFLMKLSGLAREFPWVAYHHGYTTTDLKMLAYNQFNRWSLPSATRVVTVCEAFAQQLAQKGVRRERISVRHNSIVAPAPVSVDEREALKGRLKIEDDERVVLAVGRLSREKAHVDLVHALGRLRELEPGLRFQLVIVGDGPEKSQVEQAAASRGLDGRIVFAGHVGDVRPFYAAADVLALPSHSEGSPNVLLEAMAAGVPVVATRVGGVPEIAEDEKSALLVAARDTEAMAAALRRVLEDSSLAATLAANAKRRAVEDYSPEAYTRSLVEIYCDLLGGRKIPAGARVA